MLPAYLVKIPFWIKLFFPHRVWSLTRKKKHVYLTFDDGPIPEVTPWVLEQLKQYQGQATFFCIGKNIEAHPEIFNQIISEGHRIGNHTHHHLNAQQHTVKDYVNNTRQAQQVIDTYVNQHPPLFRPPYGKLPTKHATALRKLGYKIIMWEILSADFDPDTSPQKSLENVLKNIQNGSIIVFHDSVKAQEKLHYVLPQVLAYLSQKKMAICALD